MISVKRICLIICLFCLLTGCSAKHADEKASDQHDVISAEQATKIALTHAGLEDADDVFVPDAKPEMKSGICVYEVTFSAGDDEYEYTVDAVTGKILSYDYENRWAVPIKERSLTIDDAKKAALDFAGVDDTSYLFTKEEIRETAVFDFEFIWNDREYEAEILSDGTIAEFSMESL